MASTTFQLDNLLAVQAFQFKTNISANFKAWLCVVHPDYIRPSLDSKIAPADFKHFKRYYNYDDLKNTQDAPWYNFVKRLPILIQDAQKAQDAQNDTNQPITNSPCLEKQYNTLQQQYDKLLSDHLLLKEQYHTSNSKLEDITLKYNTLKTQSKAELDKMKQLQSDLFLQLNNIIEEYTTMRQSWLRIHDSNTVYKKQVANLRQEINQIKQAFQNFQPPALSPEAFNTLQTKYQNPSDFIQQFSLICPITQDTFIEPVIALDGKTYEKQAILKWFQKSHKSPETGQELPSTLLIPNIFARTLIDELHNHNTI
tara:strand:- start:443 stop:1378 length:936 start_codon:yes stop_codon:yes gene_type:complete